LGLGRRRRNRGGEGRQRGHILTFSDGFTDEKSIGDSVGYSDGKIDMSPYGSAISNPLVIPSAFKRGTNHVTVRICHFKSLSDSIDILNGEPVTSLYGVVVLNPLVKIAPPKPPR
jgi:hypothetical protein